MKFFGCLLIGIFTLVFVALILFAFGMPIATAVWIASRIGAGVATLFLFAVGIAFCAEVWSKS